HPHLRCCLPAEGGGVLLRVPGRLPDQGHRRCDPGHGLVSSDRVRRHARGCLGHRSHRERGPVRLARGLEADTAQSASPPRGAADFHRRAGHAHHRLPRRHTPGVIEGQIAGLELRHRQHARVEDRIRQAKAAGLRNLPCRAWNENVAWLQVVLMATDLVTWTKLIAFTDTPALAKCEIAAFRYRVLHVAAHTTRGARQVRLRIDRSWRWAAAIATGWGRIRTAFG